jgi:hypothetical protein
MTVDHFRPRSHGGDDTPDNLVYCCHACNEYKEDYWTVELELILLRPPLDQVEVHLLELPDGTVAPRTDRGSNHADVLHLNRPELVAHRLERASVALSRRLNQELRQQLLAANAATTALEAELDLLTGRQ